MTDLETLSEHVIALANEFEECPPMQAILHGAFTLYLSGEKGLIYLVLMAASIGGCLEGVHDD